MVVRLTCAGENRTGMGPIMSSKGICSINMLVTSPNNWQI